jgi:hypothetical protein
LAGLALLTICSRCVAVAELLLMVMNTNVICDDDIDVRMVLQVPILTHDTAENIPANSLVRFRGMVSGLNDVSV